MNRCYPVIISLILVVQASPVLADSTEARCDIYRRGADKVEKMVACNFSQRQGAITISREDGVTHELLPLAGQAAMYRDDYGFLVTRRDDLGSSGLIFRFEDKSIYVYWDTSALYPERLDASNPTAPYTTVDYDATTRLRCGSQGIPLKNGCAAGVLRMDDGQASIVVTSPTGVEFTINVMHDHVNASGGRDVSAVLDGDTWIVNVDGRETYDIPLAALDGG